MKNLKFTVRIDTDQQIVTREILVETNGCYYFFNAQHLYLQLSSIERSYFDFMCEKMDYRNRILLNRKFREEFKKLYNNITSTKDAPVERTLQRYEKKLIKLKLVIKIKGKGFIHYINPKYATKETFTGRKKIFQNLSDMAFAGEIDLSTIIDLPIDKIKLLEINDTAE